jgi:hypothetical protein
VRKASVLHILEARLKKAGRPLSSRTFERPKAPSPEPTLPLKFDLPEELVAGSLQTLLKDPMAFFAHNVLELNPPMENSSRGLIYKAALQTVSGRTASKELQELEESDFFAYQKARTMLELLRHKVKLPRLVDVWGEVELASKRIRGHVDLVQEEDDQLSLIILETRSPHSTKDIIYGDEVLPLLTCLIARGFEGMSNLNHIQFWNLTPARGEVISQKEIEVAPEVLKGLRSRIEEILSKELFAARGLEPIAKYQHFERI